MLSRLQPTSTTDLVALKHRVSGRRSADLVSRALNDALLLSLAKELRQLTQAFASADEDGRSLAAPLFLAFHLHMVRREERGEQPSDFSLSEPQLAHSLQLLQFAVEREIVTRIVGLSDSADTSAFLEAFDKVREVA